MKRKEKIFIISVLLIALASWGFMKYRQPDKYGKILITVQGKEYGTYSLGKDQQIKINHTNICEIKNGQAVMTDASCPDHVCMEFYPITKDGGMIICLPNGVMIEGLPAETR